jgi:hypothetical protein
MRAAVCVFSLLIVVYNNAVAVEQGLGESR